jgi:Eukaryotic protein of unknown function (DUF829)
VIVSYSNGGAFCYEMICRAAEAVLAVKEEHVWTEEEKVLVEGYYAISGAFFDSAPAAMSSHAGAMALSSAYPAGSTSRIASYYVARALNATAERLGELGVIPHRARDFWEWMDADRPPFPLAYVYSLSDEITEPRPLAALVSHKREMGCNVAAELVLEKSPHVAHLRTDAAAYKGAVRALLEAASVFAHTKRLRIPRL